jgi:hypothetical protein
MAWRGKDSNRQSWQVGQLLCRNQDTLMLLPGKQAGEQIAARRKPQHGYGLLDFN